MTHRNALLAAICAAPDDDTPRLVFADWLEEQSVTRVTCPRCNGTGSHALPTEQLVFRYGTRGEKRIAALEHSGCGRCHGTGTVADDFNTQWAELIRVQCELEPLRGLLSGQEWLECHLRIDWLKGRESTLLAAVEPVIRRGAKCGRCEGTGNEDSQQMPDDPLLCRVCHGGYTGTLARKVELWEKGGLMWHYRCDFSRGFPQRVYCTLEEYQREVGRKRCFCRTHNGGTSTRMGPCPGCGDRGTVPVTFAEALLREHGTITEIVLTDREPADCVAVNGRWYWFRDHQNALGIWANNNYIPDVLFDRLDDGNPYTIGLPFATRDTAIQALARAAADHARELAGLTPLANQTDQTLA